MNFKLIKYLVEKIEKHYNGSRIDFRTVTNGMFLTPKRIDFMNDHNFKLYVSLDGPKQIHEYLRGAGTFDLIMDNLKYLKIRILLLKQKYFVHILDIIKSI